MQSWQVQGLSAVFESLDDSSIASDQMARSAAIFYFNHLELWNLRIECDEPGNPWWSGRVRDQLQWQMTQAETEEDLEEEIQLALQATVGNGDFGRIVWHLGDWMTPVIQDSCKSHILGCMCSLLMFDSSLLVFLSPTHDILLISNVFQRVFSTMRKTSWTIEPWPAPSKSAGSAAGLINFCGPWRWEETAELKRSERFGNIRETSFHLFMWISCEYHGDYLCEYHVNHVIYIHISCNTIIANIMSQKYQDLMRTVLNNRSRWPRPIRSRCCRSSNAWFSRPWCPASDATQTATPQWQNDDKSRYSWHKTCGCPLWRRKRYTKKHPTKTQCHVRWEFNQTDVGLLTSRHGSVFRIHPWVCKKALAMHPLDTPTLREYRLHLFFS